MLVNRAFDTGSDKVWDAMNRGVGACTLTALAHADHIQRQWKDIKQRYMEKAEEDE